MRGTGRIRQAHVRGFYVAGTAAAFLERRATEKRPGGVAAVGDMEKVDGSRCGVCVENVANGAWDAEQSGRGWGGGDEGGIGTCKDVVRGSPN